MPALVEAEVLQTSTEPQFSVTHQEVELDIDFRSRKLVGLATITIQPLSKDLRIIPLNCRGIEVKTVTVEGHSVGLPRARDPHEAYRVRDVYTVKQHHQLQENVNYELKDPPEPTLVITLPKQVRIKEFNPANLSISRVQDAKVDNALDTAISNALEDGEFMFSPITLCVQYIVEKSREALRWIGLAEGDSRYPHVYTCASSVPGLLPCFVFPYVGLPSSRCSWRLTINCPRTIGDFARRKAGTMNVNGVYGQGSNGHTNGVISDPALFTAMDIDEDDANEFFTLTDEEMDQELVVIGSGLMEDSDAPHQNSHSTRRWVFHCSAPVGAHHIGFAIGPFEQVDFVQFRETGKEDQLKEQAVSVHGFCLPGREDELRNTGLPLQMAIDHFQQSYTAYPFAPDCQSYKLVFVDDLACNVLDTATLSICSSRLLFPENVIDPAYDNSRELIRAAASQWIGVFVSPKTPSDYWIIVGASYFMADIFMSTLWGRNEVRYRQKLAADKIIQQDIGRPSIFDCGKALGVDHAELEFLVLKAPVVFFIFHQRLMKQNASTGAPRVLVRLLSDARMGRIEDGEIWTDRLIYTSDKVAHQKLQSFFDQWVFGAGCPTFHVSHKFNKKKMSVEVTINQTQANEGFGDQAPKLDADNFMREVREHEHDVYAGNTQPAFTGPITVRIQEADGRPYEHIVEIREQSVKVEFNYNTKYKRLKRTKRAKERAAAIETRNDDEDGPEDAPITYALGDVLQGDQEIEDWKLTDWSQDDLSTMQEEAYEWIRLDKDFEWICSVNYSPSPNYMFVQQLQQDNDVVAQIEALQWLSRQTPNALHSSVFTRTLMDHRYFHGVRTLAAGALAGCAAPQVDWIGLFHLQKSFSQLFCFDNSPMTRSNDFSDQRLYRLQCTIPKAMASIRDSAGKAPLEVKRFFLDKLKFNDNSNNQYSDSYYVAILIAGLAETLVESQQAVNTDFSFGEDLAEEAEALDFKRAALNEIDRLRRIDEWIPSYENLYTRASLRGLARMVDAKVVPHKMAHFLRYTRAGNQDEVRLTAFESLVNLGMLRNDQFLRYIFYSFASESSQFVRQRLWRVIGRGLGLIALGITKTQEEKQAPNDGFTIITEGAIADATQTLPLNSVEGALAELKRQMSKNEDLQDAIMDALRSPHVGLNDFTELLELCGRLYEQEDSLLVTFNLPRYWKAEHVGGAQMRFFQIKKFRTQQARKPDVKKRRSSIPSGESPQAKRQKTAIVFKAKTEPPAAVAVPPPLPPPEIVQPQAQLPSPTNSQPPSFTQPAVPTKPRKQSPAVPKSVPPSRLFSFKFSTKRELFAAIVSKPPRSKSLTAISAPPRLSRSASSISPPAPAVKPPTPTPSAASPPASQGPPKVKLKLKMKLGGGST